MAEVPELLIYESVKDLMHAAAARLQEAFQATGTALGPMEARCLAFFARHDDATQSGLVRASGRDKAQIARITKILLDRELVETVPEKNNGRATRLRITAAGAELHAAAESHRRAVARRMVESLNAAQKAEMRRLLAVMSANLQPRDG